MRRDSSKDMALQSQFQLTKRYTKPHPLVNPSPLTSYQEHLVHNPSPGNATPPPRILDITTKVPRNLNIQLPAH